MAQKKKKRKKPIIRDYAWYREQRVKLKKYYPRHPDKDKGLLDFPIPSEKEGFTTLQKQLISIAFNEQKTKYEKRYDELKKYVDFTFKKPRSGDFTPQQKSAISAQYNKLKPLIEQVKKDRYTAIPLRNRKGVRVVPEKTQREFKHTNKVCFIPEGCVTLKVKRKGSKKIVILKTKTNEKLDGIQRNAVYIPIPEWVYDDPTLMPYFMRELVKKYPGYVFRLSYRGAMKTGGVVFTPRDYQYIEERFASINYGEFGNPITGLWGIYYGVKSLEHHFDFKAKEVIEELEESIFNEFGDTDIEETVRRLSDLY